MIIGAINVNHRHQVYLGLISDMDIQTRAQFKYQCLCMGRFNFTRFSIIAIMFNVSHIAARIAAKKSEIDKSEFPSQCAESSA